MIIILLITNTSNNTVDFLAAVAVEAVVDSPSLEVAAAYTAVAVDTFVVVVAGTFVVEDTPCLELRHRVGEAFQAACCRLVVASYPAA